MQVEVPPAPDQVPVKKKSKGGWIVLGILAVLLIGALVGNKGDTASGTSPVETSASVGTEITADDVVDVMGPAKVESFCGYYRQLGDYEKAYEYFKDGYGAETPGVTSLEIFDELVSRC